MICLIRHGETEWNHLGKIQGKTDIPLNETGKKQAKACRDHLEGSDWDLIISSPLQRAKQTAEIINEKLNLPLIEMEIFQERSFGDAEGLTLQVRQELYPNGEYPGMESKVSLTDRVMNGMEEVIATYPNQKILLVAHGAVINEILSVMSDGEIGTSKTTLLNACISNVQFIENKWKIHNYNQTEHLGNL
ncbi:histidine phosphatase family protein [Aquibacillus rhizosphaerae]|uniref:Histidine phosphatase family protein n=1 Tax=Aquibacillus rhizosphaerae TaxID=3051431 RepID=A0ABT7L3Q3_9BACI|nr:histidine phosphatase family protein [Aquibacillus sp. LR5S19]MDL4840495.1 histidine phosphatase family protein [Aquibacillus sp. LR5S19]